MARGKNGSKTRAYLLIRPGAELEPELLHYEAAMPRATWKERLLAWKRDSMPRTQVDVLVDEINVALDAATATEEQRTAMRYLLALIRRGDEQAATQLLWRQLDSGGRAS